LSCDPPIWVHGEILRRQRWHVRRRRWHVRRRRLHVRRRMLGVFWALWPCIHVIIYTYKLGIEEQCCNISALSLLSNYVHFYEFPTDILHNVKNANQMASSLNSLPKIFQWLRGHISLNESTLNMAFCHYPVLVNLKCSSSPIWNYNIQKLIFPQHQNVSFNKSSKKHGFNKFTTTWNFSGHLYKYQG